MQSIEGVSSAALSQAGYLKKGKLNKKVEQF